MASLRWLLLLFCCLGPALCLNPGFQSQLLPIGTGLIVPGFLPTIEDFVNRTLAGVSPIILGAIQNFVNQNFGNVPLNNIGPWLLNYVTGGYGAVDISNSTGRATLLQRLFNILPGYRENMTSACYNDTLQWANDLLSLKSYAISMLDSFGKLPPAILKGHILWFGGFEQCMETRRPLGDGSSVQAGDYCMTRFELPSSLSPKAMGFATCFPRSCSPSDVDHILTSVIHVIGIAANYSTKPNTTVCLEAIPEQEGTKISLILIGIVVLAVLWATLIHFFARVFDPRWWNIEDMNETASAFVPPKRRKSLEAAESQAAEARVSTAEAQTYYSETTFQNVAATQEETKTVMVKKPWNKYPGYMKVTLIFSVIHNVNKLFSPPEPGTLRYLDGMRVMSMWWIILGHVYQLGQNFFSNQRELQESLKGYYQQIPLNAYFAVDTFFFLSGLSITYSLLREMDRTNSWLPLAFSYVRRVWRLLPLLTVVLLIYMFIVPYIAGGPYPLVVRQEGSPTELCKSNFWTVLGFVHNLYPTDKNQVCMAWTWFIAADTQLFVLTPILVAVLSRFPKVGLSMLAVLVAACAITVGMLVSLYGIPLTAPQLQEPLPAAYEYDATFEYIFDKPWTGGINYFAGVMVAFFLIRLRPQGNTTWRLWVCLLGWVATFFGGYFCVWGLWWGGLETPTQMGLGSRTAFAALGRLTWALVLSWIVYACQYNYGKVIKSFLSLRIWTPLSRLTYAAFLVHTLILQVYYTSQRAMLHYQGYQIIAIFLSQCVAVYMVAMIAYLFIEKPLLNVMSLLYYRRV